MVELAGIFAITGIALTVLFGVILSIFLIKGTENDPKLEKCSENVETQLESFRKSDCGTDEFKQSALASCDALRENIHIWRSMDMTIYCMQK